MRSKTIPKRTIRDSVFTALASKKPYLLQIFQALHPEDTTTTADNLQNVTLHNVLVDGQYNDLGFEANGKTIILIEAQTQWSDNIILRIMLYYLRTLDEKQERDKKACSTARLFPCSNLNFTLSIPATKQTSRSIYHSRKPISPGNSRTLKPVPGSSGSRAKTIF